jgi:hypothetical protein
MEWVGLSLAVLVGVSLGFFGGGGSILTVPLLVYVFGLEPKPAIASSLLIVGTASAFATAQHWRLGNVEIRTGLVFGLAGMLGAYLGGRVSALIDGALLLVLFATAMGLTSLAMWRGRRAPVAGAQRRSLAPLVAQGVSVGFFTGLVGAGGGFLIVPALVLWADLPIAKAVGTSLAIIVLNSAAGFAGYASHVELRLWLLAAVSAAAVTGSFLGARLARRVDPQSLRRAFAGFVLAMAVLILAREMETWLSTARAALPRSLPQALFVLAVLALGVAAGRVSRAGGGVPVASHGHEGGSGI